MNALPIVTRELRVAARRGSTFWVRVAGAITGLLIGGGCLLLSQWQGRNTAQLGGALFAVMTWICLAAALGTGLFFTSDCLSEEKREGTLGLLFLTDLRGYDVVFGKLLATSLRGAYALLAVLPILATTQLMGGVTGPQYWKSALALVNGLFCSLTAGILVSSISRDSQKALTGTLTVLVLLAVGGPIADVVLAQARRTPFQPYYSLTSPAYALITAGAWGRAPYWDTLLITASLGVGMLALACVSVPHSWQDKRTHVTGNQRAWVSFWRYGSRARRRRLRLKLLEAQPMAWLVCRERWQALVLWTLALVVGGIFLAALNSKVPQGAWIMWNYIGSLFALVLYLWVASQAVRSFLEPRRSGLTELLLVSPINEMQIITGHWRGVLRMFGLPLLLLVSVQVAGSVLSQLSWHRIANQVSTAAASTATNQVAAASNQTFMVSVSVGTNSTPVRFAAATGATAQRVTFAAVAGTTTALGATANLVALYWVGLWMGMTSRSANLGTLKTLLFVQIIPWFIISFVAVIAAGMIMAWLASSQRTANWFAWWPLFNVVLVALLSLSKDVAFILWSRRKLYLSFRAQAAQIARQRWQTAPPMLPPLPSSALGQTGSARAG